MRDLTYGPMAILPEALGEIRAGLEAFEEGRTVEAASRPRATSAGGVAVIPIAGPLTQRPSLLSMLFGGSTYHGIERSVRQAASDPNVKAIVLAVDSPGGDVIGAQETAAAIRDARRSKHVVASVTGLGASAAYWLASQADEIAVTPSGQVGSIGVIAMHMDESKALEAQGLQATVVTAGKYKGEASSLVPLSEEGKASLQAMADEYYIQFVGDVAAGRNVSRAEVRGGYGEGRMVTAEAAVKLKMADRVATLDQVLAKLGATTRAPQMARAAGASIIAAAPGSFKQGDRVRVSGDPHMPGQSVGTVEEVAPGTAYGIRFDGTDMVHRWYVDSELEPVDSEQQDMDMAAIAAEKNAAARRRWLELELIRH